MLNHRQELPRELQRSLQIWPSSLTSAYRRAENITVFTIIVAELKLGNIQRHVFCADLVERADHTAFAALQNVVHSPSRHFAAGAAGASIVRFPREDAAYAAARVSHVAVKARNEMHVQVHPRLATGLADVHADIVAVRRMLPVDLRLRLVQKRDDRVLRLAGHVEEIGDVAHRNDEDVSTAEREIVVPYIGERIAQHHVLLDAQRAKLVRHCFSVARHADYIHFNPVKHGHAMGGRCRRQSLAFVERRWVSLPLNPSCGLQEPVERRIGQRGNHFQFAPPLDLQMDQSAFPAASRLRPRGGGLRRSLSSARAQICSTHIPRIA
jgi:hypothetical protein